MRTATTSRSSSVVSRSLAMASEFSFSGISSHTVSIPTSMGMMAFIPYVRANRDMPISFRLVVL